MTYTHVLNRGGLEVQSPLDHMFGAVEASIAAGVLSSGFSLDNREAARRDGRDLAWSIGGLGKADPLGSPGATKRVIPARER